MEYYITSKRTSEIGYWDKSTATTLAGAKLEATRTLGKGYRDATLCIGIGDNLTAERQVIASRKITDKAWQTAPGYRVLASK